MDYGIPEASYTSVGGGPGAVGAGLSGLLGIGGALYGRNAASQAENKLWSIGDPYRAQLQNITFNPNAYFSGPIAQELARQADARYSANFGNPAGSGTAQALALQAMLGGYGAERDRLFREGGGDYLNQAYPSALAGKNQAGANIFGGLQGLLAGGGGLLGFL